MRTSVFTAVFFSLASLASAAQLPLRRDSVQLLASVEQQACLTTCVQSYTETDSSCLSSSDETTNFACLCEQPAAVASLETCVSKPCPGVVTAACTAVKSRAMPSPAAIPAEQKFEVLEVAPLAASTQDEPVPFAAPMTMTTIGMPHVAAGLGLMVVFWLVLPS